MPFAPPDINLHGNASVRIVLCFTPLEKEGKKKKNYKLEMCHTFLGSRLGIRIQFDKGFLALGWGKCFWVVKPSHSGSRSTFLNFQRGCLWVTGITHPLIYSVGSLTAISESRNRLLNDLKESKRHQRWQCLLFATWEPFSSLFCTFLPWEAFAGILI